MYREVIVFSEDEEVTAALRTALEPRLAVTLVRREGECLDAVGRPGPAILFLDLDLVDLGGYTLLDAFRRLNPETLIVVCGSDAGGESFLRAWERGAGAFVRKPFPLKALADYLAHLIGG